MESSPYLSSNEFIQQFNLLSSQGKIAFYNQVKIFTVFYSLPPANEVYNLYTLVHFEEVRQPVNDGAVVNNFPMSAGPFSLKIQGTRVSVGLMETTVHLNHFSTWIQSYVTTPLWNISGAPEALRLGEMKFTPKFFVPNNGTYDASLNQILKNNIFNGSYILEQFDECKTHLELFLNNPDKLMIISEKVQKVWPVKLAAITDRLGNILFQFPVKVLNSSFKNSSDDKSYQVDFTWDSRVTVTPSCKVITISDHIKDNLIRCAQVCDLNTSVQTTDVDNVSAYTLHFIYDQDNKLILGSSNHTIIKTIPVDLQMGGPSPRIFQIDGEEYHVDIHTPHPIYVGAAFNPTCYVEWIKNRQFEKETKELEKNLEFKQYGLESSSQNIYTDLHNLINKHAKSEILLWDPYLNAKDIKNTLYFLKNTNIKCLAIGSYGSNKNRNKFFRDDKPLSNIKFKDWLKINWRFIQSRFGLIDEEKENASKFNQWKVDQADELKFSA